jgi:hypothetical protein
MYKQGLTFTFSRSSSNNWRVTRNFESKIEFDEFLERWSNDGVQLIAEELVAFEPQIYPQVLKLNLKSKGNSYYTIIERFKSSEEFIKYCEFKLLEGFKVIGSEPYKNL